MARGWQGTVLRVLGARDHLLTVRSVETRAPGFLRIGFTAPTLFDQVSPAPGAWLRFWFPDPGTSDREHQRGYTIATADPSQASLDVDFLLHEPHGPASAWAAAARPGDEVVAVSLGSTSFTLDDGATRVLLIGDASAVPAINGNLAALPTDVDVHCYIEDESGESTAADAVTAGTSVLNRVVRSGADSLAAAVSERDWSGWQIWAAGESASMKAVRGLLRKQAGVRRGDLHVQAYWVRGRTMGTDRSPSNRG